MTELPPEDGSTPPRRILVCDDEPAARRGVVRALSKDGQYTLLEAADGTECLHVLERPGKGIDLVLLDLRMPGMDGLTTLDRIAELDRSPPVVVVTADASVRSAVAAVKAGASDYLSKPFDIDELRLVVRRTLEHRQLVRRADFLEAELDRLAGDHTLIGESAPMVALIDAIERVAPSRASVVIFGESGTGKELVARQIHAHSRRARQPFVALNCAAIPDLLVESELFGHVKGAFTGADRDRKGRFEQADGGTLLLDEIGDMSLGAQSKLLRVLQEEMVEPVGSSRSTEVDVRVLAATHRDLREAVNEGNFREDLLFRLRVVELDVPPLRERGSDVLRLARHFLRAHAGDRLRLDASAERILLDYRWPGNVRELANVIERATIFCRGDLVTAHDLPSELREAASAVIEPAPGADARSPHRADGEDFATAKARLIESFERRTLSDALRRHRGNVSRAALDLGLHRQNVQQKLRKLGLRPKDFRT